MFMKQPGGLQSGKWQRSAKTADVDLSHEVNIKCVESHFVQEQLCFSDQIQGKIGQKNTKMDIPWLVSDHGTLCYLGEPKSSIANVPKGISSCNLKAQNQK